MPDHHMKYIVYGLRHGECDRNDHGKYPHDAVCLNESGKTSILHVSSQVQHIITTTCPRRVLMYTSPIHRAYESAHLLSASLNSPSVVVSPDHRLSNKQENDVEYTESLVSLMSECRAVLEHDTTTMIVWITHGRVLKMIQSVCEHGRICRTFTDGLDDYECGQLYEIHV